MTDQRFLMTFDVTVEQAMAIAHAIEHGDPNGDIVFSGKTPSQVVTAAVTQFPNDRIVQALVRSGESVKLGGEELGLFKIDEART